MKKLLFLLIIILYVSAVKAQNVGISSTVFTPQSLLHLYNPSDGNMLQISNTTAANSGFQVYMAGSDYSLINREPGFLSFHTDDTERMRILSGGNVGINVQTPATTFHVRLTGATDFVTIDRDVSGYGPIMDWYGYGQTHRLRLEYINGMIYNFQTDDANRHIAFNPSGNFGINTGTISPTANLHVNGTVRFENLGAGTTENTALLMDVNGNLVNRTLDAVAFNGYTETDPNAWKISGNSGTTNATDFIGTTDAQALDFRTNNVVRTRITTKGQVEILNTGQSVFIGENAGANDDLVTNRNTFVGYSSGELNNSGTYNSAFGSYSLMNNSSGDFNTALGSYTMMANTTGSRNVAIGNYAMRDNTIASYNIAMGYYSMFYNTTSENNIAIGAYAMRNQSFDNSGAVYNSNNIAIGSYSLYSNNPILYMGEIRGVKNIALGSYALYQNRTGSRNIAIGDSALLNNTGMNQNIAIGAYALQTQSYNTNGLGNSNNIAIGSYVLNANVVGSGDFGKNNTAVGTYVMRYNTSGYYNAAFGYSTLNNNTTGHRNVAMGLWTLNDNTTGYRNTAIGSEALGQNITGYQNTALGVFAGYSGTAYYNSTALGAYTAITGNNMVRIGNSSVTSIGGYANWTNISDRRFKDNIENNVPGLDFIMLLEPVTYNLNIDKIDEFLQIPDSIEKPYDYNAKSKITYTGFIAQDVEAAALSIGYDFSGVDAPKNDQSHYGLRYAEFVVPLVQATQEQQVIIEQQQQTINAQQKEIDEMKQRLEAIEQMLSD
ncbi:MAG: tail fiber domain-containing protein [Bacteroidales bacterium]|nr:tail fiber domain-containing protein [Bacteroidales bacterium]